MPKFCFGTLFYFMITASIVVHNTSPKQLSKALDCLLKSKVEKVFIIDNSPKQDLKFIVQDSEKVSYYHVKNDGFGAGHNFAIKKAMVSGSKYHLVMNADVWWEGDVIERLEEYLNSNEDIGLISPKVFYPDGDLQYTCRLLPTPLDLFFKRFLPSKIGEKRMENYLLKHHDHDFPLNCPYLLGSFMFFRVEALKDSGQFDERFFMYPEDIDITRRIHKKWKTLYFPEVSIIHEHQQASKKSFKMFWIHFFNMVKYFNKWGWWKDSVRKEYNKSLLESIKKIPKGKVQKGRG